jgi:hypothetical protein
MSPYFDTGVLVKSYVLEPDSAAADALIKQNPPPIPITHFHEIELRNALRLKRNRLEITDAQLKGALRVFDHDIAAGFLEKPDYDLRGVFHKAEELSTKYAVTTGARSLDILHVAAALVIGARIFVSFDKRQRAMANKAGLKILPLI